LQFHVGFPCISDARIILFVVVTTSAISCMERLDSEMTRYMLSAM